MDGQIIGIPRSRAIGRNGLGYRTDWAEAVGITEAVSYTHLDVYKRQTSRWVTPTCAVTVCPPLCSVRQPPAAFQS